MFQWRQVPILAGLQCINRQQRALVCDTENLRIVYETRENIFSFDIRLKLVGWEEGHSIFSPIMGIFTFPVRLSQKYWVRYWLACSVLGQLVCTSVCASRVMMLTQAWRRGHSNKDLQHAQLEEWNLFCSFQAKSFQYAHCIIKGPLKFMFHCVIRVPISHFPHQVIWLPTVSPLLY